MALSSLPQNAAQLKELATVNENISAQAVRNLDDLECLACPPKYRELKSFYKYYTGQLKAPYLTIFSALLSRQHIVTASEPGSLAAGNKKRWCCSQARPLRR